MLPACSPTTQHVLSGHGTLTVHVPIHPILVLPGSTADTLILSESVFRPELAWPVLNCVLRTRLWVVLVAQA